MLRHLAALACALLVTGCGNLAVEERGSVDPGLASLPGGLPMTFDPLGGAVILPDKRVELPLAREGERFGVTVVDTTPLRRFAPAHVGERRVMVSALDYASPLAVAGLRPFDVIAALDGQPVTTIDDLVARLGAKEPGDVARLSVQRAGGVALEVEAEAVDGPLGSSVVHVPFLFERHASAAGSSLGLGPIDLLFFFRSFVDHFGVPRDEAAPPLAPAASRSRYARRFEWGALFNIIFYVTETDVRTDVERSKLRLFWVIDFGDDMAREGQGGEG
jgi:hypothetical protein